MVLYNFKQIPIVPSASDFIDIVLSRTQRQTPTVCHAGWKISRIRQFYMRKVKHTQTTWHDGLSKIIDAFPNVQAVHPFYSDLLNVLYDRDHYKLALGQLNVARNLIDKIAQDYVRLLKYGDSQYRCKQLKRAALGRMATVMKKQGPGLKYLEQVRQHMSRLPSIDPNSRTLLLCGYPNVGKSSFINLITRADVEVEPYAFTTKSLYVGHMDYKYLRWQVIDTPGLLDRPLEERNTIEMQSITALAHIRAAVVYIVDISEQCGYTIAQQVTLFHSLKPLFTNKPIIICCNKIDARSLEALSEEDRQCLQSLADAALRLEAGPEFIDGQTHGELMTMSTMKEEGVMHVRNTACDRLLNRRVDAKLQGNRTENILNRIHVAMPQGGIDPSRPPCIPESVLQAQANVMHKEEEQRMTIKEIQEEMGGGGVYSTDDRQTYLMDNPEWKYDIMPEIWDGHNVLDFVDPDIDLKLRQLEIEEAEYDRRIGDEVMVKDEPLTQNETEMLKMIRRQKQLLKAHSSREKSVRTNYPAVARAHRQRNLDEMAEKLTGLGMDPSSAVERVRSESRKPARRSRSQDVESEMSIDADSEHSTMRVHSTRSRSLSRGRSASLSKPTEKSGLKDRRQMNKAIKISDRSQWKRNKHARKGEGDRHIPNLRPKHLYTGIRGIGKTTRSNESVLSLPAYSLTNSQDNSAMNDEIELDSNVGSSINMIQTYAKRYKHTLYRPPNF